MTVRLELDLATIPIESVPDVSILELLRVRLPSNAYIPYDLLPLVSIVLLVPIKVPESQANIPTESSPDVVTSRLVVLK